MPRVALLFEYFTLNGGERSILAAIDWLRGNDDRFEFVAIAPPVGRLADELRTRGIAIRAWSLWDDTSRRYSAEDVEFSLQRAVDEVNPDLLHGNSLAMGRLIGRAASDLRVPTTAHLRDIIKLSASAIADLNRNRMLIAVSEATRVFHVSQGFDSSRVCVVRNGIDLKSFQPKGATGYLHSELGLPFVRSESLADADTQSVRLIAAIGQIGLRKGLDVLAAAAPLTIARIPGAHFLFIGERLSQKEESVRFEQSIQEKFVANGIADRLHLLGYRGDVADILNEVDLLVHSANQEPFGRVLLEGCAVGVPIVATDVGGTSEIIIDHETGVLVPSRNPPALAAAMIDLLIDRAKAVRYREAARRRAESEFGISNSAQKLAQVWERVLN